MKKRSQVTLFIIIGLFILVTLALILYVRITADPGPGVEKKDPVKRYVEECTKQVTEDALARIGMQAGFVTLDKAAIVEDNVLVSGSVGMPYWFYQDHSGFDRSEMPMLEKSYEGDTSIESQLEHYIGENLQDCLAGFSVFEAQGTEVAEMGILEPDAIFTEESVEIQLDYPLRIYEGQGMRTEDDYHVSIPVRLKKVYELAKSIRDHEMSELYLERNTRNLISIYSRIDSRYLPPMYGGLHFVPCHERVHWVYSEVQEDLSQVLSANIPYMKIAGTMYDAIKIEDDDEERREIRQGVYDSMVFDAAERPYPDIQVDHVYSRDFPLELDFGSVGLLEPHSFEVDMLFSHLCMLEYQFAYNVKYPVLVTLTDTASNLGNQDYLFQFPMQAVIKDNFPRVRFSEIVETPVPNRRSECDSTARKSAPVTVKVKDDKGRPLDDVSISFQCGPSMVYEFYENGSVKNITEFADRCFIGTTTAGVYKGSFPQCSGNGILMLEKEGHLSLSHMTDEMMDEEQTIELQMDKLYELEIDVEKFFVKPPAKDDPNPGVVLSDDKVVACNLDEAKSLQSYEQAIIKLEKTDTGNGRLPGQGIAFYSPENKTTLSIGPGEYEVEIALLRNERYNGELTIKEGSQRRTLGESDYSDEKTITYPDKDVLLPTVFTGGAIINFTLAAKELEAGDAIRFYVIDEGPPATLEEVARPLQHRKGCSLLNYQKMRPEII